VLLASQLRRRDARDTGYCDTSGARTPTGPWRTTSPSKTDQGETFTLGLLAGERLGVLLLRGWLVPDRNPVELLSSN
jgi:hypothetical protein